jgi:protein-disulfide isomerase
MHLWGAKKCVAVTHPRWSPIVLTLLAVTLGGATCQKPADAGKPPTPSAPPQSPAAPTGEKPPSVGPSALAGIPGMDFSPLPLAIQSELANVLTDEFCHCGCPHTLLACLKTHAPCRHAKRATQLAAATLREGATASDAIVMLGKYYQGFRAERAKLPVDPKLCLGSPTAKVTLVEFSDFECPYCAAARPLLEDFAKSNPNIRFCYSPFPLQGHANALPAGQAALFARDFGKFWQIHDALFENQMSLSPTVIRQLLTKAGLNAAEYDKAVAKDKYLDELNASKAVGKAAGVDSTPALYVNGRKFTLPINPETLGHAVEDELEWMANNGNWASD